MKVAMGHYIYMKKDGLNSMDYTLNRIEVLPLYTRIFVKLPGPETQKDITNYYNKKVAKYKQWPPGNRQWTNVGLMLGQRLRRWPNIKATLARYLASTPRRFNAWTNICWMWIF